MRFIALSVVAILSSGAIGAESREIPLKEIWAYNMPGTRDVGTLESNKPPATRYGPLVRNIRNVLSDCRTEGKKARTAFAVSGTGHVALREAHAVIVEGKKPHKTFPVGGEISAVVFSCSFGAYVHLHKIERKGNLIEIDYRFVPHKTKESTEHFAIVPLGPLPAGEYLVAVINAPMDQRFVDAGVKPIDLKVANEVVSRSFSISVVKVR